MPQDKSLFERLNDLGVGHDTPQDKALRLLAERVMMFEADQRPPRQYPGGIETIGGLYRTGGPLQRAEAASTDRSYGAPRRIGGRHSRREKTSACDGGPVFFLFVIVRRSKGSPWTLSPVSRLLVRPDKLELYAWQFV